MNKRNLNELLKLYEEIKNEIKQKIKEFNDTLKSKDPHKIFKEFIFCLFTPQSKAEKCWEAVCLLEANGLLYEGTKESIEKLIRSYVRFYKRKSNYMIENRKIFHEVFHLVTDEQMDPKEKRRWIVSNVKGFGMKEASHFLRNVGVMIKEGAILDRHVITYLKSLDMIQKEIKLTAKNYEMIENVFEKIAVELKLLPVELDFIIWYKLTGRIFK